MTDYLYDFLSVAKYPENFIFELLENEDIDDYNLMVEFVDKIHELGAKIAIDDFGTGYSSLGLLGDLPVETLKLDKGFVRDIMTNTANQAIIKAIAACARDLNIDICLEGMESKEMVEFAKQFFISCYQGYYYSRPIIMGQFLDMYLKR